MTDKSFWKNKKVFLTGHTGFKGAWLAFILNHFGAQVTGYALEPPTNPNLFELIQLDKKINSIIGDVRDFDKLKKTFDATRPEIVFHLAAQPLVLEGYKNPADTYSTNVMGTVNILECVRLTSTVKSFLNVTTDKVYHNNEWAWGYRENDTLDGIDPYSNSKSCSELVTACYRRSFFACKNTPSHLSSNFSSPNEVIVAISTARAGNVIGGGDFAAFRIIPDCVRAALAGETIKVRNPNSIRPYQHVLEPLLAYMMIVEAQYTDKKFADCYNVGPDENDCVTTGELVKTFCDYWGEGLTWESLTTDLPREANFLKLDCSKIKSVFNWSPRWNIEMAIEMVSNWTKIYRAGGDLPSCMERQLEKFLEDIK